MRTNEEIIEEAKRIFLTKNQERWDEVFPLIESKMRKTFPDAKFIENKFGYSFWELAGFELRVHTKIIQGKNCYANYLFEIWIKKGNDKDYPYSKVNDMYDFGKYVLGKNITGMYLY